MDQKVQKFHLLFGPFPNNRIDFFIASTRTWLSRVEEEIDSFLLVCTSRVGSELARLCLSTLREVDRCDKDEMTSSYNLDKLSQYYWYYGYRHGQEVT